MKISKKAAVRLGAIILLAILVIWTVWGNTAPMQSTYTVASDRLPASFDGYRIAQISDLHNAEMGESNARLLQMLEDAAPDVIVITGDMVDCHRTDTEISLKFAGEALKIAPCYYITGNHEAWLGGNVYAEFERGLTELGVCVLRNEAVTLEKEGESITLIGIDDPDVTGRDIDPDHIRGLSAGDIFTVLLSHRPESFDEYVSVGVDLVFSGHAHGGQFRLPLIGGVIAPNQGFFPVYDAGLYTKDGTAMIVSRGIGNSVIPMRFNNRPEIVLAELVAAA